jgi:hypothetical protein
MQSSLKVRNSGRGWSFRSVREHQAAIQVLGKIPQVEIVGQEKPPSAGIAGMGQIVDPHGGLPAAGGAGYKHRGSHAKKFPLFRRQVKGQIKLTSGVQ